jgi:hypothetical protein
MSLYVLCCVGGCIASWFCISLFEQTESVCLTLLHTNSGIDSWGSLGLLFCKFVVGIVFAGAVCNFIFVRGAGC